MKTTFISAVCLTAAISAYATCDKSLDDFPAFPGEDAAARIQRAVNALPEGSLYIPKGVYRMSSTLMVTNRCSIELNRGATLRAEKPLEYVVKVDARPIWRTWNLFFNGGIIDGNGLASCMALDGFSPFYMRNVTFLNGKKFGLRVNGEAGGGGIFANDLYFRCTMHARAGRQHRALLVRMRRHVYGLPGGRLDNRLQDGRRGQSAHRMPCLGRDRAPSGGRTVSGDA